MRLATRFDRPRAGQRQPTGLPMALPPPLARLAPVPAGATTYTIVTFVDDYAGQCNARCVRRSAPPGRLTVRVLCGRRASDVISSPMHLSLQRPGSDHHQRHSRDQDLESEPDAVARRPRQCRPCFLDFSLPCSLALRGLTIRNGTAAGPGETAGRSPSVNLTLDRMMLVDNSAPEAPAAR